jgi:hypothetical protein
VRKALGRYGFDVVAVHIGLAVARPADRAVLARQHADNDAYRQRVLADGGDVLLGELHQKPSGIVEEKVVDGACNVRITRYVDEILYRRSTVEVIVVLSKDIDLTPSVDYAMQMKVSVVVAALDVVQHRPHPYVLLGPKAYADMVELPSVSTGHELREFLARALFDGQAQRWRVSGSLAKPRLLHRCGLVAVPAPGLTLPPRGNEVSLYPVDVVWDERILGAFPLLVCDQMPSHDPVWVTATVRRRTAPMTIEVDRSDRVIDRVQFPQGGVIVGEQVLIHRASGRALGRLSAVSGTRRAFDPDEPRELRVVSKLPSGGALVADASGRRGLLTTDQMLSAGQRLPGIQVDHKRRGPVWSAVGRPWS